MQPFIDVSNVPKNQRLDFLPKYFGKFFFLAEQSVYNTMSKLAKKYQGSYWDFFELSNGGFYMAPACAEEFEIFVEGNLYEGILSADAVGIVVCLIVINGLCWCYPSDEQMIRQYYLLSDFALNHIEACEIFSAID